MFHGLWGHNACICVSNVGRDVLDSRDRERTLGIFLVFVCAATQTKIGIISMGKTLSTVTILEQTTKGWTINRLSI